MKPSMGYALLVLFGLGLFGMSGGPTPFAAAAEPVMTEYQVWGKDARVTTGQFILLGRSITRAGAEQTLAMLMRHGGFVGLHIKEVSVKPTSPLGLKDRTIGNVKKPPGDGMVQPKKPIDEIKPKPPAPKVVRLPKASGF